MYKKKSYVPTRWVNRTVVPVLSRMYFFSTQNDLAHAKDVYRNFITNNAIPEVKQVHNKELRERWLKELQQVLIKLQE